MWDHTSAWQPWMLCLWVTHSVPLPQLHMYMSPGAWLQPHTHTGCCTCKLNRFGIKLESLDYILVIQDRAWAILHVLTLGHEMKLVHIVLHFQFCYITCKQRACLSERESWSVVNTFHISAFRFTHCFLSNFLSLSNNQCTTEITTKHRSKPHNFKHMCTSARQ